MKDSIKKQIMEYLTKMKGKEDDTTAKLKNILALYDTPLEQRNYFTVVETCTCWNSLAYCCASPEARNGGKQCPFRDAALELLNITMQEYEEAKNNSDIQFTNLFKNGGKRK